MKALTARQRAVLEFVERYIAAHGYPPGHRDICREFGFKSTPVWHLGALAKKGAIEWTKFASRTLRVLTPTGAPPRGRYQAGKFATVERLSVAPDDRVTVVWLGTAETDGAGVLRLREAS